MWRKQRKLKIDGVENGQFNRADSDPLHRTVCSRTRPSPGPYAEFPTATASVMAQRGRRERGEREERGNKERLEREREEERERERKREIERGRERERKRVRGGKGRHQHCQQLPQTFQTEVNSDTRLYIAATKMNLHTEMTILSGHSSNQFYYNIMLLTLIGEPQLSADHGGFSVVPERVATHSTPGTSDTHFHSPLILSGTSCQSHVSVTTVGRGV